MAYTRSIYYLPRSNEIELHWAGKYGAKGEKRAPREKATPEQIRKQNQWKKECECRRTMKLNFETNDLWCTLLYPAGSRKELERISKDAGKFIRTIRRKYKKWHKNLKYMIRYEIGARGGIHIHILVNQVQGDDRIIQEEWKRRSGGRVNFQRFGGEEEDFRKLSEYLVKGASDKQREKLNRLQPEERKKLMKYSTSKNLVRPKPEKKPYSRRTVRKLIEEGPAPTPGYYIDKNSIITGVNKFTGTSYMYYTEVLIKPKMTKREDGG